MTEQLVTRRQAFRLAGVALVAWGLSGCGAAASAGRVVISVAWKTIDKVVFAIVNRAGKLIVTAIVDGVEKSLDATLPTSLEKGGKLFLRTEDGVEHDYTIN